jgi:hypothetical protein
LAPLVLRVFFGRLGSLIHILSIAWRFHDVRGRVGLPLKEITSQISTENKTGRFINIHVHALVNKNKGIWLAKLPSHDHVVSKNREMITFVIKQELKLIICTKDWISRSKTVQLIFLGTPPHFETIKRLQCLILEIHPSEIFINSNSLMENIKPVAYSCINIALVLFCSPPTFIHLFVAMITASLQFIYF